MDTRRTTRSGKTFRNETPNTRVNTSTRRTTRSGKTFRNETPNTRVNTSTRRTTRSGKTFRNESSNTRNNRNTKRRKTQNSLVKAPYVQPTVSKTNIAKGLNLISYMKDIPIYAIHAHSIIRSAKRLEDSGHQGSFEIPKDTFIMSLTTPGEFMCSAAWTTRRVHALRNEFRKYLHMHSQANVIDERNSLMEADVFEGIRRAGSGSMYPNIVYGFKDYKPNRSYLNNTLNVSGVYNLTKMPADADDTWFYNNNSIIKQEEAKGDPDYMLKDIIQTVYERTGISKGIFILMGCLVNSDMNAIREGGVLIDIANAEYPTRFETFTKEELMEEAPNEIPRDRGMYKEHFHPLSEDVAINMVKEGLYTKNNADWVEQVLPSNRTTLRQKLQFIKVPKN